MKNISITKKAGTKMLAIRKTVFFILTILWILMIAFCFKMTAHSMGMDEANKNMNKAMEKEYISNIRAELKNKGYENAGVMLTNISYADGNTTYTLRINHKNIGSDIEAATLVENVGWPIPDAMLEIKNM